MSTTTHETAEQIHNRLPDEVSASVGTIEAQIDELVREYDVPIEEAQQTVERRLLDEAGVDRDSTLTQAPDTVEVASIDQADQWVSLKAKVATLWDADHESIAQTGLLADDSGTIKFTLWAKSADDLPTLVEGETYRFGNVVTDEYQGRFSVNINGSSEVSRIDTEFDTDQSRQVSGAIVDISGGSGLIKRCGHEDCTRTLSDGRCREHGDVDGDLDLRIKMVLDDGEEIRRLIFDDEQTEALTGLSMDAARDIAMDALDRSAVADRIEEMLVGHYLEAEVEQVGRWDLVQEASIVEAVPAAEEVLIRGRSMQVTEADIADATA